MRIFFCLFIAPLCVLSASASAQVYKCTDQNGKVSYVETPCGKAEKSQQLTKLDTAPAYTGAKIQPVEEKLWDRDNRDFNARRQAVQDKENAEQRKRDLAKFYGNTGQAKQSDQSIIAACEKNYGARCSDPATIAQSRADNTPITREQQIQAIGERRAREQQEADDRASRR